MCKNPEKKHINVMKSDEIFETDGEVTIWKTGVTYSSKIYQKMQIIFYSAMNVFSKVMPKQFHFLIMANLWTCLFFYPDFRYNH